MDINNPIIKLVHKGMQMENESKINLAKDLYMQAWNKSSNDNEKCIAAHFVARHQDNPEKTLYWNQESLSFADNVKHDEVKGYYPSLYLNIAVSYEDLNNYPEAKKYYDLAFDKIIDLPIDKENEKYNEGIRRNIIERRQRLEKKL